VAIASLDLFHETQTLDRVRHLERWLRAGLVPLGALPVVGDVRVIGGVGIMELVGDKSSKSAGGYLDHLGPRLADAFLSRGLLLRPLGNILYFMPPYVITDEEVAWALGEIAAVLSIAASAGARC
jgi:adenosylmethionine-8-amino-7-oxononanoate aminotransferase